MSIEKIQYSSPKVPELVMQAIINAIEKGHIKVGSDLPSERDLAEKLGVGRGSLRECLAILEFLGAIESSGNRKKVSRDADYIRKAQSWVQLSNNVDSLDDFLEFRQYVEVAIVKLACQRATQEDLEVMRDAVERMEKDPHDSTADMDFHDGLAAASHNMMMAVVIHLVTSLIDNIRDRFLLQPEYLEKSQISHRELYEAVKARDEQLAEREMNNHLEIVRRYSVKYPEN